MFLYKNYRCKLFDYPKLNDNLTAYNTKIPCLAANLQRHLAVTSFQTRYNNFILIRSSNTENYIYQRYKYVVGKCPASVNQLQIHFHTYSLLNQWGIFPVWEIRGFPILLSRSGKNCQSISHSGNKMINFVMPQHVARRINTTQRLAKTNSLAKS